MHINLHLEAMVQAWGTLQIATASEYLVAVAQCTAPNETLLPSEC
jgi:hypothetical protein